MTASCTSSGLLPGEGADHHLRDVPGGVPDRLTRPVGAVAAGDQEHTRIHVGQRSPAGRRR